MFHRWNQQSLKCRCSPSTIRTVVLQHTAVFLLLSLYQGQAAIIGSSKPIVAMIGEDVILPCRLVPGANVAGETLEWSRPDLNPRYVHVRRDGVELLLNQNPLYVGRTSVSINNLKRGDMSLTISGVRPSDEGTYRCLVPAKGTAEVKVLVGAASSPVITIEDITTKTAALQCEAKGWSPEPELLWLDNKGNNLTAERTRPQKDAGGLYRTSSRVSVETKKEQVFTCRVQQKNIHQTREAHVHIQDNACTSPLNCAACIATVVAVVVLLLSLVPISFFVLGRRRQRRKDKAGKARRAAEEERLLQEGTNGTAKDDRRLLQENKENMDCVVRVISVLEKVKKDLENLREEERSMLEEVEENMKENEDNLRSAQTAQRHDKDREKNMTKKELKKKKKNDAIEKYHLMVEKEHLKKKKTECNTFLNSIEERIKETIPRISKITEVKNRVEKQVEEIKQRITAEHTIEQVETSLR